MGCICSKPAGNENVKVKHKSDKSSVVQLVGKSNSPSKFNVGKMVGSKPANGGSNNDLQKWPALARMPGGAEGELAVAGWPQWLTSAAGEAIQGMLPRRADSFEKLYKIGQGTYSSVYKARDLDTGKIVAMKKVRFMNMDPESVRFMAREIHTLRRLDHPNVIKLESIVTSRVSESLCLVFEYMEHDLSGLASDHGIKFTEPQIKCFIQQLFRGLEHCHNRGVLHRDIKGSNLLISGGGVLKIGDFGLATFYQLNQNQALTSRVVTLWYRAPELLLGATDYGTAIDLWSTGCILAELFAGKPIMPGRTEVEQMHKIFKLCGSPSDEFWQKTKLPIATSFKHQYRRRVCETFKSFPPSALALVDKLLSLEPEARGSASSALRSKFFTTEPFPCHPSTLPKYPPSKELDANIREEEQRRIKAETVKGRGPESVRRGTREFNTVPTPEFIAPGQLKATVYDDNVSIGAEQDGFILSTTVVHPDALGTTLTRNTGSARTNINSKSNLLHKVDMSSSSMRKDERLHVKDSSAGNVPRKNRIHCSGPLMPPGGNIEDMLKEHERQIQHAVRKARLQESGTKNDFDGYGGTRHIHRR